MKLTVSESSPDYWPLVMGNRPFRIRCNGVDINYAVEADTVAGTVTAHAVDRKGRVYGNYKGDIVFEELEGLVEVIPDGKNVIEHGYTDPFFYLNGVRLSWKTYAYLTAPPLSMIRARGAGRRVRALA